DEPGEARKVDVAAGRVSSVPAGPDRSTTTSEAKREEQRPPKREATVARGTLRLATCQFPVSADVNCNSQWIRSQMRQASEQGAALIHFPECPLSGYAGVDLPSVDELDWNVLHGETESILALARELKVWVVLGSPHRLSDGHKPHNCLYVISPEGKLIDR